MEPQNKFYIQNQCTINERTPKMRKRFIVQKNVLILIFEHFRRELKGLNFFNVYIFIEGSNAESKSNVNEIRFNIFLSIYHTNPLLIFYIK